MGVHAGFVARGPMAGRRGPMLAGRGSFAGVQRGAHWGTNFWWAPSRGPFFRTRPFFHHRHFRPWWYYGYAGRYGYPWWYSDYSYPEESYSSYDYAEPYYPQEDARLQQQQAEIDRLNDEVERLRQEREERNARPAAPSQPQAKAESQPTALVFRDRHTEDVQNYAIVGQTLWVFNEQRARKILLADLDLPATQKANEDRGVDFRVPD